MKKETSVRASFFTTFRHFSLLIWHVLLSLLLLKPGQENFTGRKTFIQRRVANQKVIITEQLSRSRS
jgi:hypothetical protein